jgi:hypothetical protein
MLRAKDNVRAVTAPTLKHGPRPGPFVKEIKSSSLGLIEAFSYAAFRAEDILSVWNSEASLGWIPLPSVGLYVILILDKTFPLLSIIPIPSLSAEHSIPREIIFEHIEEELFKNSCFKNHLDKI